jgi:hypothetical protein
MYTKPSPQRLKWALLCLALGPFALPAIGLGQSIQDAANVQENLAVDIGLKALRTPMLQPILYPPQWRMGPPDWPLYKQQPPEAQSDFRPPPPVQVIQPKPKPKPTPVTPAPTPTPPSPPPPQPCSPNDPNWPNC